MSDIPVIINNFNRLSTTKKLVEDLKNLSYNNVHILDNKSSYLPLLEWYNTQPSVVKRLDDNLLQLAVYNSGYINEFIKEPWIAYTDSDIELNQDTPFGFIETLIEKAEKYDRSKAGLALRIDDLPDNEYANHYRAWEEKYWQKELEPNVYDAHIDTTFCVIKPGQPFDYAAVRVGGNMTARHVPWYADFHNLTSEEKYYLETSNGWSTYKRFYYSVINKKTA
jgi:hypothetical protein